MCKYVCNVYVLYVIIILCVWHHNYLWCEQAVLQVREKGTVQSHSLLQHNVVHEPLQHCVYLWYTPQPTHIITAHTYCTPHKHTLAQTINNHELPQPTHIYVSMVTTYTTHTWAHTHAHLCTHAHNLNTCMSNVYPHPV